MNIQIAIACILLLLLGYVHGSQKNVETNHACAASDNSQAVLERTVAISPSNARYVFVREDGCSILVYAQRFPVLVRGTQASILGKQKTPIEEFDSLPDYAQFLMDDGISLVVQNADIQVIQNGHAPLDAFRVRMVSRIGALFREPDASLITAMIAGDQGMIPQYIKDIYRKSGITHILSISGLHVSVIAVVLTLLVGLLNVSPPVRSGIIFALLWIYIAAVGSPASAVRAGVFWTCYVLAYHIRALMGLLTIVLLTLAILLTHSPSLVRSIGFELSVMAVCGIGIALFFLKRIYVASLIKPIATLMAVSLGATLTTAPLTLYYFGNLSLVGLITNMLVVPLLPFITYLVLFALVIQPFVLPLALAFSFVVHLIMVWILFVATLCASILYGNFSDVVFPLWGVVLYYALLAGFIIVLMKRYRISWREWWV